MNRLLWIVSVLMLVAPASFAAVTTATAPDFWYVLPESDAAAGTHESVRGIVLPSTASPTLQTTAEGAAISWRRPDGTRQSLVVRGVPALSFERGPLDGTTLIPFGGAKRFQVAPDGCCTCASFENSRESVEALSCVAGCPGCGCEGCICSPTFPCPFGPDGAMRLVANNGVGPILTISKPGTRPSVTFDNHGTIAAQFTGRRLDAKLDARGVTVLTDPDSITLFGPVTSRSEIRGDKSLVAWSSPEASVILEQPAAMPIPSLRDGTISFESHPLETFKPGRRPVLEPTGDRCRACGTHPDSVADTDIYDCVPGNSICYRCVSWECSAP
jgi:hypothetical protein